MSLEEFAQKVLENMREKLGEDMELDLRQVAQLNGTVCTGICIGKPDAVVSPILYLDVPYHEYLDGDEREETFTEIIERLFEDYQAAVLGLEEEEQREEFWEYEAWKDRIVYRLVRTGESLLTEGIPRIPYLDLSIVFYGYQQVTEEKSCAFLIRDDCMKQWNVDVSELYRRAKVNTPRLFPAKVSSLLEVLGILGVQTPEDCPDQFSAPFYVITNENMNHGAAALLYEGILKSLAENIDADLVLIPSSVHEWLALPYEEWMNMDILRELVCQINAEEVSEEERLSDRVYRYSRERDQVEFV